MPYIAQGRRGRYDHAISLLKADMHEWNTDEGDLNYIITSIILKFLGEEPRYKDYNTAIGVLECAKLELYRRKAAPYEDKKVLENGEVY